MLWKSLSQLRAHVMSEVWQVVLLLRACLSVVCSVRLRMCVLAGAGWSLDVSASGSFVPGVRKIMDPPFKVCRRCGSSSACTSHWYHFLMQLQVQLPLRILLRHEWHTI